MKDGGAPKCPMFGKTVPMSRSATPNHFASAAPYWSDATVGIQRPRPFEALFVVSSGPPFCSAGKIEPVDVFGDPVEVAADDAVADDELVAAPAVVRADAAGVARFRERAAEVREREGRDLVLEAELHGREVEGRQRLREREEVVALVRDLVLVCVVAALRDEEDLALQG